MIDTKNFYGGSLHVCYAPEFESLSQTRQKILQRQRDVMSRLNNLQKEREKKDIQEPQADNNNSKITVTTVNKKGDATDGKVDNVKLNMGEINTIAIGKQITDVIYKDKGKRKMKKDIVIEKRFKPSVVKDKEIGDSLITDDNNDYKISNDNNLLLVNSKEPTECLLNNSKVVENAKRYCHNSKDTDIDVIDYTSPDTGTLSNINEALNYNKFGNEDIRKIESKPLNKIKLNLGNKK